MAGLLLASNGLTGTRGRNEFPKQALRQQVFRHALRMPLNTDDPVGITGPLNGFDRAVGGACGDAQILAWFCNGLVMRTVNGASSAACN